MPARMITLLGGSLHGKKRSVEAGVDRLYFIGRRRVTKAEYIQKRFELGDSDMTMPRKGFDVYRRDGSTFLKVPNE